MSRQQRRPPVLRDTVLWVCGLVGIGYQQVTQHVAWPLLVVYLAMLSGPGVLAALVPRGGGEPDEPDPPDTPSPPSSSPRPSSPPPRRRRS